MSEIPEFTATSARMSRLPACLPACRSVCRSWRRVKYPYDDAHVEWDEGKLSIGGYNIHSDNCDLSVYVGGKGKLHLHRKGNGTPEPRKSNAALHDADKASTASE